MIKEYTSLGLMSGTSGDGLDVSIIKSDGKNGYLHILDKYFPYNNDLRKKLLDLKEKILTTKDLKRFSRDLKLMEEKITVFHANSLRDILKDHQIDIIGFHGQTIFHNAKEKISIQLGDGKKLSRLLKKSVVFNFRENDLKNNGEGAPLTPIFHKLILEKNNIKLPASILNIGGIANLTSLNSKGKITSSDIGPGNCLIDKWIRNNSNKIFDNEGKISAIGNINKIILDQALDNYFNNLVSKNKSFDTSDFDISFVRGLSLKDGAATLTEFTAQILSQKISNKIIYICGGGRYNNFLIKSIQEKIIGKIYLIDDLKINGDFVESQAFAYLAIRKLLNLPVSFPETTGCLNPTVGGKLSKFK